MIKRKKLTEREQAELAARLAAEKATLVNALLVVMHNGNCHSKWVARCALVAVGERVPR